RALTGAKADVRQPSANLLRHRHHPPQAPALRSRQAGAKQRIRAHAFGLVAEQAHELILGEVAPSRERALALNKAYRTIVADQDYVFGRDAVIVPPRNVYDEVDPETAPTLRADRFFPWDMRLDWDAAAR
ncbi:MAG: hypothetical protein HC869_21400, partial [Rhodospirillales bacterium]|nr:hypothetical protein [Rhodospirillales bacterium]